MKEIFDRIYRERLWGDGVTEPLSGKGSMAHNNAPVVHWIRQINPAAVLDIGCGDLSWMPEVMALWKGHYTGLDVSEAVFELFQNEPFLKPGYNLLRADASAKGFRFSTNMVIVKDVLFHLEDSVILQLLENLAQSSWRWLIVNTDAAIGERQPLNSAHWAMVDLESGLFGRALAGLGTVRERASRPEHGEYLLIGRQ